MMNFGYNNRWVRLVKDIIFVAVAVLLIVRGRTLGMIVGLLAGYWYGRDAYLQAKVLWQEKTYKGPEPGIRKEEEEDGKITVTNLQDAKEVDFEKE